MMTRDEIRAILAGILPPEPKQLDVPSEVEWRNLESRFQTKFPEELKAFIELMAEFSFPGEVYNVPQAGRTNGNDTIVTVYEIERQVGWPANLVPFYGIGNGDYFAIDAQEGQASVVYFVDHENESVKPYARSVSDWIQRLPNF